MKQNVARRVPLSRHAKAISEATKFPRVLCRRVGQYTGTDIPYELNDTYIERENDTHGAKTEFREYKVVALTPCTMEVKLVNTYFFVTAYTYIAQAMFRQCNLVNITLGQTFVVPGPTTSWGGGYKTLCPLRSDTRVDKIAEDHESYTGHRKLWPVPQQVKSWNHVVFNTESKRYEKRT
jgi:hypothetical protein